MKLSFLTATLVLLLSAGPALAGDEVPSWLQQAATIVPPTYEKDVPAVVLLDEQKISVNEEGRVVRTRRHAVRILHHEGRFKAIAREIYQTDTGKVKELRGWLVRSAGKPTYYGKDQIVDVALAMNDVYNEYRVKVIVADNEATAGTVFGFEVTSEDRSIFSQFDWDFQDRIPTLLSRVSLELPKGWRATSLTFNHPNVAPSVAGSNYTWEVRNLPPIPNEPLSPPVSQLAPRVAVSYFPAEGSSNTTIKTFADWAQVAQWMSELEDPQVTTNEAIVAKVRELTANSRTEYERIQAIGRYVQSVKYISIQTGIGRGGGYRPRSAIEVFAKSYGDCKDKTNLMRAMLKVVGIDSFGVSIFSGDPDYVRPEWPSPQQFNHCIIAVKVSKETQVATVIEHPRLGRLLIFDPTAEETTVGDLPTYLQGSLALIDAKESDSLVKMPTTPPELNMLERQIEASLDAGGALTAKIAEQANGQWGAGFRREFRGQSRVDYTKRIESWVTAGATAARVSKVEPRDDSTAGRFDLDIEFTAPQYGQLMQDRLLIFKPTVVSRRDALALTESKRKHPVVLDPLAFKETVRVKLPPGWEIDELPERVEIVAPFGSYAATYTVKDGHLVFTRNLLQKPSTVPVEKYTSVRSFFEQIRAAERAPVVLAKK